MSTVSVIIPCYNSSLYISRCMNALEEQSYRDFTVIFVDDCSTDNTLEVLTDLKNKVSYDVIILENDINSGPAVSRNKGILASHSKYITFCDADDWYDTNYLKKMVELLESYNADIVLCGYKVINEYNKVTERLITTDTKLLDARDALSLESDSLCMLMVKTDIMKNTLLPNIRNGEDVAIVPLIIIKSRVCIAIKECLYYYYRRDDSASQKPNMMVVDSLIDSYRYTAMNFPKNYDEELEYIGIKNLLYSTMITLFSFGYDKKKALAILSDFERIYPNWNCNKYFIGLPSYKKLVLKLAKKRMFIFIKLITIIRDMIT